MDDIKLSDAEEGIKEMCRQKGWKFKVSIDRDERWLTVTLGEGIYLEAGNAGGMIYYLNKLCD